MHFSRALFAVCFCMLLCSQQGLSLRGDCDQIQQTNLLSELEQEVMAAEIKPESEALDDLAASSDLIVAGEIHKDLEAKRVITASLTTLYRKGYRVLGLEMLNKSAQANLDQYCSGDLSRERFIQVWRSHWLWPQQTDAYLETVEKACRLGFKVVALDIRDWFLQSEPEYERMQARNYVMAATIINAMQGAKAMALLGSQHAVNRAFVHTTDQHVRAMTQSPVPEIVRFLRPELKVSSVFIGSRTLSIDDSRYCRPSTRYGEFKGLGAKAPNVSQLKNPTFAPFDLLLLQTDPNK